jgi:hypothetical protein
MALFESVSDTDMCDIARYMNASELELRHPLFLPTMLLDILLVFYVQHRKELQLSLFALESQLGITRGKRATDVWSWDFDLHRDSTKLCDTAYTSSVYLERRLSFAIGLSDFILDCLECCVVEKLVDGARFPQSTRASKALKENVCNNRELAKTQLAQALCLQKRCQALTVVVG